MVIFLSGWQDVLRKSCTAGKTTEYKKRKWKHFHFLRCVSGWQDVLRKSCTAEGLTASIFGNEMEVSIFFILTNLTQINLVRLLSIKKGNENISISFDACRDDKIWTCDLRSPRPLRYRAAPHPVVGMCLQEETRSASFACRHSSSILEATSFSDVFQRIYCIRNSSFYIVELGRTILNAIAKVLLFFGLTKYFAKNMQISRKKV